MSPEETVEKIHELGGLVIIPHPFTIYRNGLFRKMKSDRIKFDGIEVLNGRYLLGYSNYRGKKLKEKRKVAEFGASDSHFLQSIGDCYTEVDCEAKEDLFDGIKKRKTKARGKRTSNYLIAKEVFNKKIKNKL
jgi:predicted metal-dependent phosphoesterase TrpH